MSDGAGLAEALREWMVPVLEGPKAQWTWWSRWKRRPISRVSVLRQTGGVPGPNAYRHPRPRFVRSSGAAGVDQATVALCRAKL